MSKNEMMMDRFAGGLLVYMQNYFSAQRNGIYRPEVGYSIPHAKYILEHWNDVCDEVRTLKPICEYSAEIKEVAVQYLQVFLKEYPAYKNAECFVVNK